MEVANIVGAADDEAPVNYRDEREAIFLRYARSFFWFFEIYHLFSQNLGDALVETHLDLLKKFRKYAKESSMPYCYSNRRIAQRLLTIMERMLPPMHMAFDNVVEEKEDYLRVMTEIVAMFIDLSILATKLSKRSLKELGSRMTTHIFTYLLNSEAHICEAIFLSKLFNVPNREFCLPVVSKIANGLTFIPYDKVGYLRNILIYRLWRRMESSPENQMDVVKNALEKLSNGRKFKNAVNDMPVLARQARQAAVTQVSFTEHLMNRINYTEAKLIFLNDYSLVFAPDRQTTRPFTQYAPRCSLSHLSTSRASWQGDNSDEVQALQRVYRQPRSKVIHVIDISGDNEEEIEMIPLDPVPRLAIAPPPPALAFPPPPPVSVQVPVLANAPAALAPIPARVLSPPPASNPVNPASFPSPAPLLAITSRDPTNAVASLSGSPVLNSAPAPWGSPIQGCADSTTGIQQVAGLDNSSFEQASSSPDISLGVKHEERRVSITDTEPSAQCPDIRANFPQDSVMDGLKNVSSKREEPPVSAAPPVPCKGAFDLTVEKSASPPLAPEAAQLVLTPTYVMLPRARQPSTPRLPLASHRLNSHESPSSDRSSSSTTSAHTLSRPWLDNNYTNSKPSVGDTENSSRVGQILETSGHTSEKNVAYCVLPSFDISNDPQASDPQPVDPQASNPQATDINGCASIYFTQLDLKRKEGGLENCGTSFDGKKRMRYEDDRNGDSSHVDLSDLNRSAGVPETFSADLSSYGLGPIRIYPKDTALSELAPMQNEDVEDEMTDFLGSHRNTGTLVSDSSRNIPRFHVAMQQAQTLKEAENVMLESYAAPLPPFHSNSRKVNSRLERRSESQDSETSSGTTHRQGIPLPIKKRATAVATTLAVKRKFLPAEADATFPSHQTQKMISFAEMLRDRATAPQPRTSEAETYVAVSLVNTLYGGSTVSNSDFYFVHEIAASGFNPVEYEQYMEARKDLGRKVLQQVGEAALVQITAQATRPEQLLAIDQPPANPKPIKRNQKKRGRRR